MWKNSISVHLAILLLPAMFACGSEIIDDTNAIGVIAEAYTRNRESFTVFDCKFVLTRASSATVSDALAGKLVGTKLTRIGEWLVDGKNVRYELGCPPADLKIEEKMLEEAKSPKSKTASVSCTEHYFLRDKAHSLSYVPLIGSANLFGPSDVDSAGIRVTPFNLDFMGADEFSSPDRYLRDVLNGRFKGQFIGSESINGVEALCVRVTTPLGEIKLGFDPQRNYMLVYQADERQSRKLYEFFVLDAREVSGSWFPMRTVKIRPPNSAGMIPVEQLTVEKLDTESKPANDRFQLVLAAGTQVGIIGRPEWTKISQSELIGLDDLVELNERCVATGKAHIARQQEMANLGAQALAQESPGNFRWRGVFLVANIGLLLVISSYLAWRRFSLSFNK